MSKLLLINQFWLNTYRCKEGKSLLHAINLTLPLLIHQLLLSSCRCTQGRRLLHAMNVIMPLLINHVWVDTCKSTWRKTLCSGCEFATAAKKYSINHRGTRQYTRHSSHLEGRKAKALHAYIPTDRRTDTRSYRVASSRLKRQSPNHFLQILSNMILKKTVFLGFENVFWVKYLLFDGWHPLLFLWKDSLVYLSHSL